MSKEALKIPVGMQIFKGLTCHGYWHSQIWSGLSQDTQDKWVDLLTSWKESGKVRKRFWHIVPLFLTKQSVSRPQTWGYRPEWWRQSSPKSIPEGARPFAEWNGGEKAAIKVGVTGRDSNIDRNRSLIIPIEIQSLRTGCSEPFPICKEILWVMLVFALSSSRKDLLWGSEAASSTNFEEHSVNLLSFPDRRDTYRANEKYYLKEHVPHCLWVDALRQVSVFGLPLSLILE